MSNLSKSKLGKFVATIVALSSTSAVLTVAQKAEAVPLYPNDFGSNTQVVRLQMERNAPNGQPVTLNITRNYGLKNGGLFNTWIGQDSDSLFKYITNGSAVNFQSNYGGYSISVPTLEIRGGTPLNTYASGFGRYQDWNIEKLGGQYGDTYLFHWRTDTNTNLCLDIRGFGQGQQLHNQTPVVWYCDPKNDNQRIRVIKPGQATQQPPQSPTRNPNDNYLPWQAGYTGRLDQGVGGRVSPGGVSTHGSNSLALDFTVEGNQDVWTGNTWRSIVQASAVRSGVVEMAQYKDKTFGNTVIIRHDDGNKSQYSHLYNFSVSAGQRVVGGQNLGLIGMTGLSHNQNGNGVHIHFQMMNANNQMIGYSFKDAPGADFNITGRSYTSQNR
jgi:hypothetical protein